MSMPSIIGPAAADSLANAVFDIAAVIASAMFAPTGRSSPECTARVSAARLPAASRAVVWIRVAPGRTSTIALNVPSALTVACTLLTSTFSIGSLVSSFGVTVPVTCTRPARFC